MATPFIGEIRQVGFNFAPPGWLPCNGQLLPIAEYDVLFTLIGTTYGGDGINTFAIPDLQGRCAVNQGQSTGSNYVMGQKSGVESLVLSQSQMASHSHVVRASSSLGNTVTITAACTWAQVTPDGSASNAAYAAPPGNTTLAASTVTNAGQSLPVEILQPYVIVAYMIATAGIFPSQS